MKCTQPPPVYVSHRQTSRSSVLCKRLYGQLTRVTGFGVKTFHPGQPDVKKKKKKPKNYTRSLSHLLHFICVQEGCLAVCLVMFVLQTCLSVLAWSEEFNEVGSLDERMCKSNIVRTSSSVLSRDVYSQTSGLSILTVEAVLHGNCWLPQLHLFAACVYMY